MLWSDPRPILSRHASERGAGTEFGPSVTHNFCLVNKLALIIRSHECVQEGYELLHGGRVITLFSASRYCGTQANKGAFLTLGPQLQPAIQQFYAHAMEHSTFAAPVAAQRQEVLEHDALRMLAERICDHKAALYRYFTQHDDIKNGTVSRATWATALRTVLHLELPFLLYQPHLADATDGRINYSHFLARYRIANDAMDQSGWQERILGRICTKLYRAMGAGDMHQAFKVFDTDASGFIEYDEFRTTLQHMDTGLSDQQVFALMRTVDTNDDGRIDFQEFARRFQVMFATGGTTKQDGHGTATARSHLVHQVARNASPRAERTPDCTTRPGLLPGNDQSTITPQPAGNVDVATMGALLQIGKALFARAGSLHYHFYHFDKNQDGVLSPSEFELALKQLGFAFEPQLLHRVMAAIDRDGGRSIDYKEFVTAFSIHDCKEPIAGDLTWQNAVLQQVSNVFYQHRIHIRHAFRMFDATNSGVISRSNFCTGIKTFNVVLHSPLSDDQIEELIDYLDSNHDGVISYKEFLDGFRVVDARRNDDEAAGDETV